MSVKTKEMTSCCMRISGRHGSKILYMDVISKMHSLNEYTESGIAVA